MDAYSTALHLLSRRELSVRQLRDRLSRRQFAAAEIDAVIVRLTRDGTVDDRRVARAVARTEASIRGRGRRRIVLAIQRLGISADVAEDAVHEVFDDVDEGALLARAIDKRLRGAVVADLDDKARARLIRQLVAQGFAPSQVLRALRDLRD